MEFIDDYCAITEYKKDQFHKTRVAIWSFIQNNQWFEGKVIILLLDGTSIKSEDQAHLDQIYDKIKLVKVDKNYHDIVKQKINKKSTDVDHSLDYAGLYALKIKSKGNLYFSSSIIFNRDVTSFLSIESAVFARKSGRLPAGSGDELNSSMFYIPGEHCSDRLFNISLKALKNHNNIFSSDSRAEIITSALREFKISIDVVDMVNLVDSSSFPDTKYRDFLRHSKAICAINMNTIDLSDPRFIRINLYWQQINRQSIDYKPSTIKINKIKANSKALKHLEVGRHKISLPKDVIQLDLESEFSKIEVRNTKVSDRIAVFTTLNNGYIKYAITCFESFRVNSNQDNLDFYVFCKDATVESQKKLRDHNITLIQIDLSEKYKIPSDYPYPSECFWIFDCPDILYKLGYSHSIGVDSDTYCNLPLNLSWISNVNGIAGIDRGTNSRTFLNNIKQLPQLQRIFKMSEEGLNQKSINTGVLVFNNQYCYDSKFADRIHRIFSYSMINGIPRKGDDSLFTIFLSIFKDTPVTYIDRKYNDYYFYKLKNIPKDEPIIIHYGKDKPWSPKKIAGPVTRYYFNKWIEFEKKINQ